MFNDFKKLSFDATKQKISHLKEIFDRLNLSNLEKRLIELENVSSIPNLTFEPISVPTTPPIPTDLPDLVITNISYTTYNGYYKYFVTVQNIGFFSSVASEITIIVSNILNSTQSVKALVPGESVICEVVRSFDPTLINTPATILAEVNPTRALLETSYTNNISSSIVNIKQFYPTSVFTYVKVLAFGSLTGWAEFLFFYGAYPGEWGHRIIYDPYGPGERHLTSPGNARVLAYCDNPEGYDFLDLGVINLIQYQTTEIIANFPLPPGY